MGLYPKTVTDHDKDSGWSGSWHDSTFEMPLGGVYRRRLWMEKAKKLDGGCLMVRLDSCHMSHVRCT